MNVFVKHFQNVLAPGNQCVDVAGTNYDLSSTKTTGKIEADEMRKPIAHVTELETKNVIKHSNHLKSPGPDGFNAHFFKVCWSIVRRDITIAIKRFLQKRDNAETSEAHLHSLDSKIG